MLGRRPDIRADRGAVRVPASELDLVLLGTASALPAILPALLPLLLTILLALLPLLLALLLTLLPLLLTILLPVLAPLLLALPAPVARTVALTSGSVTTPTAFSSAAPSPTALAGLVEAASVSPAHAFLLVS